MANKASIIKFGRTLSTPRRARGANEGSALMVALIVMGILMTLSLGVSQLVITMLRDNRNLVEKTKAWYAAESGLEHAMIAVSKNPPGFEMNASQDLSEGVSYTYRIVAAAAEIPLKAAHEIITEDDRYASLRLNESVTIPLFRGKDVPKGANRASGEEEADSAKKFRVDFYLAPELTKSGAIVDEDLEILRWKIFGIAADGTMEVMSEFIPMMSGKKTAGNPSCLGTPVTCWNGAKFYERGTHGEFNIVEKHPIETFLGNHKQNFLVLSNTVNADMIQADALSKEDKMRIANIRYRVIEEDDKPRLTLPAIKISADGTAGEAKQSLDLEVKRDAFLPVFNYALYRTAD